MKFLYLFLALIVIIGIGILIYIFVASFSAGKNPSATSIFQEESRLQGYWKLEQLFMEDEEGKLKLIRKSVPGATDNYFSFEGDHVCTDGQLDLNNKPLRCQNYTTYTINDNRISIDQAGKPAAKGTWQITGDVLEISFTDENQKQGKFILIFLFK